MAPGAEHDPRSGCDDDTIDCPECTGVTQHCWYCHGTGVVSEREYDALKLEHSQEDEANQ